jgi:hypothetical protein
VSSNVGEFAVEAAGSPFDVAIFSWSLCRMDQGGMVPALEEAHRLLGPRGTVMDIHPVARAAEVEVHTAGDVVFHADDALATVVARGLFVAERCSEFDFRVYAPSARDLREFLAEADAYARQQESEPSEPCPSCTSESNRCSPVERMGQRSRTTSA